MTLIPKNALTDFDRLFEPMWPSLWHKGSHSEFFSPRVDIKELDNSYEITAELPGVKKQDVSVNLIDGVLTIEAETKVEKDTKEKGKVIRQERQYGKFMRSFELGPSIQESDINAKFEDGILVLEVPKAQQVDKEKRRIPIT